MQKGIKVLTILFLLVSGCTNINSNNSIKRILLKNEIFDKDDLKDVDIKDAINYEVKDFQDINIKTSGTYVISGKAKNVAIVVEVDNDEFVNVVLKDLTIENQNDFCINVKAAKKVFISLVGENKLEVGTNSKSAIFSKAPLIIKGDGALIITSSKNGIISDNSIKIIGGNINIKSSENGVEAKNAIDIYDGIINIESKKDGLHAESGESKGYVYIAGGSLNIKVSDDGIHATTIVQLDGGNINIDAWEGIEATYVQINSGNININASDDGINAGKKSKNYKVAIEINDGFINIKTDLDTADAIDSNGDLYINGGTINITSKNPFDSKNEIKYNGGILTVNGKIVHKIED